MGQDYNTILGNSVGTRFDVSPKPCRILPGIYVHGSERDSGLALTTDATRANQQKGTWKSASKHREIVASYIGAECEAKRLLGPIRNEHCHNIQISPFGAIPKSEPGKWRLIVDLSSPLGTSVNDGIAKQLCSLTYMTVDEVAARIVHLGRGAMMAKFDLPTGKCPSIQMFGGSWE